MTENLAMDGSDFGFSFRDTFRFDASPSQMWGALGRADLYPSWWRWMRDLEIDGRMPEPTSAVTFRVFAPIPFRMRLRVEVRSAERPHSIEARITGDLTGRGHLVFEPTESGTTAHVGWDVEVTRRALRLLVPVARPLLIRAQHWAVRVALRGFRDYLVEAGS